uniref:protein O-glucosyltransferase 1-like n=1 Tax=Erigeron canadensis TaxID=72917 RepID=UPI001CB98B12|nr:protein O-glucosyltransferase 1-like [Erigeron canadensis]
MGEATAVVGDHGGDHFDSCPAATSSSRKQTNTNNNYGMLVKNPGVSILVSVFLLTVFVTGAIFTRWVDVSIITAQFRQKEISTFQESESTNNDSSSSSSTPESCPEYFRWIHEDLKPWKDTGITLEMVEKAKEKAHFRLTIVDGRLYMEKYDYVFQTRDVFTIWGILQLLEVYPGKVPDLDLMFMCHDWPLVLKRDYPDNTSIIPPLFHYCGDDLTYDIVFPDWSFWGWPEVNILPWVKLSKDLEQGNKMKKWIEREPYAYWKGNTHTGRARKDLARCNSDDHHAQIHHLDWRRGFKDTDLASQCTHRYKIYVEGNSWSVSEKYILACDSMSLVITPHYYDFFSRGLTPTVHYWPINERKKCDSIKFAVEWGNNNTEKAQEIGKRGTEFTENELQMKFVYDYMLHLLTEYSKLFKYRPFVTKNAVEVCSCLDKGMVKEFKEISKAKGPSQNAPCTMHPPYDAEELQSLIEKKLNLTRQVEMWEARGHV